MVYDRERLAERPHSLTLTLIPLFAYSLLASYSPLEVLESVVAVVAEVQLLHVTSSHDVDAGRVRVAEVVVHVHV
jgi:hypothetical protein